MIRYNVIPKKNPQDKSVKYYAQMAPVVLVKTDQIISEAEELCTVTGADIKAVLYAIQRVMMRHLKNGMSVQLADLGNFRCTLGSEGVELAEDFTASKVKRVNLRYYPSVWLKSELSTSKLSFKNAGAE